MKKLFLIPLFLLTACTSAEAQIREEIEEANHCETVSDCANVMSKCPFDCYVLSHRDEAERIEAMIQGFNSTCQYACIPQPPFDCIEGKCQFMTE